MATAVDNEGQLTLVAWLSHNLGLIEDQNAMLTTLMVVKQSIMNHPPVEDSALVATQVVSDKQIQELVNKYYQEQGCTIEYGGDFSLLGRVFRHGEEIAVVAVSNFSRTSTRLILVSVTPSVSVKRLN